MINPKTKLTLKLNKLLTSFQDGPLTPVDQTMCTPSELPPQPGYFNYQHPQYNESDDVLPDAKAGTRYYLLYFNPHFDQLVMGVYTHLKLLPTTTPFSGFVPPLGLASRVAHETMTKLVQSPPAVYDVQQILTHELLNLDLAPVLLQLVRKRLIDVCVAQQTGGRPPEATTVLINGQGATVLNPLRQYSISNLLLTDLNISAYNQAQPPSLTRLRLRLLKLTRTASSSSSSNWLHVGNMLQIHPNMSTELFQDYVPQLYINRLANACGINLMMMDYTPPAPTQKLMHTPPQLLHLLQQQMGSHDVDVLLYFSQHQPPLRQLIGPELLPRSDYDHALLRTLSISLGVHPFVSDALDLPFFLASTEETGYFSNGFAHSQPSPRKDEEKVLLPSKYTLSEKKRDSLKMKRGIH